jgi:hypothetical protein
METSLMSESVVDDADVEETVTQVLTHFVQGGDEQVANCNVSTIVTRTGGDAFVVEVNFVVEVSACIVEFPNMSRHTHMNPHDRVRADPIFSFLSVLTFCLAYYQP